MGKFEGGLYITAIIFGLVVGIYFISALGVGGLVLMTLSKPRGRG